jgi:hypothetical protein
MAVCRKFHSLMSVAGDENQVRDVIPICHAAWQCASHRAGPCLSEAVGDGVAKAMAAAEK